MKAIVSLFQTLSHFSALLPVIVYLVKFKKAFAHTHIIAALALFSFVSDSLGSYLYKRGDSTVELFNVYYIAFYFAILGFFYLIYFKSHLFRSFISIVVTFVLIAALNFFISGIGRYQSETWTIGGVLVLVLCVIYFVHLYRTKPFDDEALPSKLWISMSLCFYLTFNFWLFVGGRFFLSEAGPEVGMVVWTFHNINNLVKNILFGVGIYYVDRRLF